MVKCITKTAIIGTLVFSNIICGCNYSKEIRLSENVKNDVLARVEDNKIKSEPLLKKKLDGLDNQKILFWIDDKNLLTVNRDAFSLNDNKIILYNYNLESGESTELLNDTNITQIYEFDESGVVLLGNDKEAFIYDAKEGKLEEVLYLSKEFENKIPNKNSSKNILDATYRTHLRLLKRDYIAYSSEIDFKNHKVLEYTILNYKEKKKYAIKLSNYNHCPDCKFDLTGKNIYTQESDQITKLNLETGEKTSMKLTEPQIKKVFEDGSLLVECVLRNKLGNLSEQWYKVDFDNKKIVKYDVNYESKNLSIDAVDLKNEFILFTYLGDGKERNENMAMYGQVDGNKIVLKDKIFKNNEDYGCNVARDFIFSPDHSKFITGVLIRKWEDDSPNSLSSETDTEYLFELE